MAVTRVRNAPAVDYGWQENAACLGTSGELFLGPDDERPRERTRREALAVVLCTTCPVRRECLDHALTVPERHGVWGGTTPSDRLEMRPSAYYAAGA